jgi:(p)ppGpp synthase/HD superfamily hydrolase
MTSEAVFLLKVTNFAAIKHVSQRRKNSQAAPYINHPIGVAQLLVDIGKIHDPVVLAAALLHDPIEDTDATEQELIDAFGSKIASVVMEVTDNKAFSYEERKRLQIVSGPTKSLEAKLVKLADKLYNLRDLLVDPPIGWSNERIAKYFSWSYDVVAGIRGTNEALEAELDKCFAKNLSMPIVALGQE